MTEPEWVLAEIIESFHFEQIREHGGLHGIRDQGMLESALARPLQLWNYSDPKSPTYANSPQPTHLD